MRSKKQKKLYNIEVVFPGGLSRTVKVKAATREAAERRALKFQPRATGVKRDV